MPTVPSPIRSGRLPSGTPMAKPSPENLLMAAAEMNSMGRLKKPDPTVDTKRLDKMKVVR